MTIFSKAAMGGAGFAIAMFASVSAHAVTTIPVDPTTGGSGGTYGDQPCPSAVCSSFTDFYSFVVPYARTVTVTLFSNAVNFPVDNVNFATPTGAKLDGTNFSIISNFNPENRTITKVIAAGTHSIVIDGSAGTQGIYNGTLSFAGVPEPMTWALMIFGFGMVGGAMRRRKSAVTTRVAYA